MAREDDDKSGEGGEGKDKSNEAGEAGEGSQGKKLYLKEETEETATGGN